MLCFKLLNLTDVFLKCNNLIKMTEMQKCNENDWNVDSIIFQWFKRTAFSAIFPISKWHLFLCRVVEKKSLYRNNSFNQNRALSKHSHEPKGASFEFFMKRNIMLYFQKSGHTLDMDSLFYNERIFFLPKLYCYWNVLSTESPLKFKYIIGYSCKL